MGKSKPSKAVVADNLPVTRDDQMLVNTISRIVQADTNCIGDLMIWLHDHNIEIGDLFDLYANDEIELHQHLKARFMLHYKAHWARLFSTVNLFCDSADL